MTQPPTANSTEHFRVFLSYSHEDWKLLGRVEEMLRKIGLQPMSDQRLAFGHGFLEQIEKYIAHAHVFMPLVTQNADRAQWVHQEIGFAAALNVPVFPVCIGLPPTGMIEKSHSLCLDSPEDDELERRLTRDAFDSLISWAARNSQPFYECAEEVEERALMLAEYADQVRSIDGAHCLRQAGGLSSFSIPNDNAGHNIWGQRWGNVTRPRFSYKCLRKERQALEAHAREAGCKLILHYGIDVDAVHAQGAKHTRLRVLIDFLKSMDDGKVEVAMTEVAPRYSRLLVGNWFVAQSETGDARTGYRNTLFTRHAATVRQQLQEFDLEFDKYVHEGKSFTRESAIEKLDTVLERSPPPPPAKDPNTDEPTCGGA